MPSPSPEKVVENIRRTLHASIPHYAALLAEALDGDAADELLELGLLLGVECPGGEASGEQQQRLQMLLKTLAGAAREDRQATYERQEAAKRAGVDADAVPMVTTAVDSWLDRWLSGKEANRLP